LAEPSGVSAGAGTGAAGAAGTGTGAGEKEAREPRDLRMPLTELLKRGLSAGQAVSESFFPRELAATVASQLVDARHGLVNAIAVEVGRFLRQADIASEMRKVLAGLNIEAKIELRFSEDQTGKIKSQVNVERTSGAFTRKSSKPPSCDDRGDRGEGAE
jgi:hypothetical protein